jgi:hypothetical protein
VLNLETLNLLLTDPALRAQVSRLISNKIKSDVQVVKASAELSRQLLDAQRRSGKGNGPAMDPGALRELVKEHLDYYETLVNLSLAFSDRLFERLREQRPEGAASKTAATMQLTVPLNATARAPFRLENNRSTAVSVGFELTPFVSEDGSELVASTGVFDPPAAHVQPGQEARVELILPVTGTFKPGHNYVATISVKGLEAMQIIVRLHVEAPRSSVVEPLGATVAQTEIADSPAQAAPELDAASAQPAPKKSRAQPKRRRRKGTPAASSKPIATASHELAQRPRARGKRA